MNEKYNLLAVDPDLALFYEELVPGIYQFSEKDILTVISSSARFAQIRRHHFYRCFNSNTSYTRIIKRNKTAAIKSLGFLHDTYVFDGNLVKKKSTPFSNPKSLLAGLITAAMSWLELLLDNFKNSLFMLFTFKKMPCCENEELVNCYLKLYKEMIDQDMFSKP